MCFPVSKEWSFCAARDDGHCISATTKTNSSSPRITLTAVELWLEGRNLGNPSTEIKINAGSRSVARARSSKVNGLGAPSRFTHSHRYQQRQTRFLRVGGFLTKINGIKSFFFSIRLFRLAWLLANAPVSVSKNKIVDSCQPFLL